PRPKVIPGPTPFSLLVGSPSGSTATCQPPSLRQTSSRASLGAPLLSGKPRPSMFDWPARTKTWSGVAKLVPDDSTAEKTPANRATQTTARGNLSGMLTGDT